MFERVMNIVMLNTGKDQDFEQMNVTAGIKKHGDKEIAAVILEYMQLRDLETVLPMHTNNSLSFHQKQEALELITLVKTKHCGKIKGRVCANGQRQRRYIKKDDVTSPTVQLESLMATMAIEAMEGRER